MKLWILLPIRKSGDPTARKLKAQDAWEPRYDKCFGFVIRAETEEEARIIANENGGDETGPITHSIYRTGGDPWLDLNQSSCDELTADGPTGVLLKHHASA